MPGVPNPPEITEAFGINADAGTITLPIPLTSATPGAATFDKGFKAVNMQPIAAGGIPPFGQDVNGILYMVSAHAAYAQAGQPYLWSATVAAALGGYKKGTILGMADGSGAWVNMVDGNATNPDNDGTAANWQPFETRGTATVDISAGNTTVPLSKARREVIILTGALTGNRFVTFPGWAGQRWLVINNTTGAFVTFVQSVGQVMSDPSIPQGGPTAPTSIWCDGANLNLAVAPAVVTGDVAPTPNTLVQRNAAGDIFARIFNMTFAADNNAIVNVLYDAGDGYMRRIALTNLEAQMLLANINGQVTSGQVPLAAVAQFLTGVQNANGGITIPLVGGLQMIFKWGTTTVSDPGNTTVDVAIAFAPAFPNQCIFSIATTNRNVAANGQANNGSGFTSSVTRLGMTVTIDSSGGGVASGRWFAIGF